MLDIFILTRCCTKQSCHRIGTLFIQKLRPLGSYSPLYVESSKIVCLVKHCANYQNCLSIVIEDILQVKPSALVYWTSEDQDSFCEAALSVFFFFRSFLTWLNSSRMMVIKFCHVWASTLLFWLPLTYESVKNPYMDSSNCHPYTKRMHNKSLTITVWAISS